MGLFLPLDGQSKGVRTLRSEDLIRPEKDDQVVLAHVFNGMGVAGRDIDDAEVGAADGIFEDLAILDVAEADDGLAVKDQELLDKLEADRKQAAEKFGLASTPTFFVNGKRLQDVPTLAALDKMIEPLLQ